MFRRDFVRGLHSITEDRKQQRKKERQKKTQHTKNNDRQRGRGVGLHCSRVPSPLCGSLHLISHFFTCLRVLISSSLLLIDFFSRCIFSSLFCFKRVSILSSRNLSCVLRMCDTLSSDLLHADVCKICQLLLPQHLAHTCSSASHASFFQVLSWMPMLLQIDYRHGS